MCEQRSSRGHESACLDPMIVLCMDVSGSMAGEKEDMARKALSEFVGEVASSTNGVGLVTFGGHVDVACKPTRDIERILRTIDGMGAGGKTPFAGALRAAWRLVEDDATQSAIVIASDGLPTDEPTDSILALGRMVAATGTRIVTVAIGADADREFLRALATCSRYAFHTKPSDLVLTYKTIASGLVPK